MTGQPPRRPRLRLSLSGAIAAALGLGAPLGDAAAGPDLAVRARLDTDNRLIVDFANRGDTPVPADTGALSIYIDGRPIGGYALGNLADQGFRVPGAVQSIRTNFRLGGEMRRVAVRVDPGNAIIEDNEFHNSYTISLNPAAASGPDFVISDLFVQDGQLRIRVRNDGNRAAPAGMTVRMRVIVDEAVAADLTPRVGSLSPGAQTLVVPSPAIPISERQDVRVLLNTNRWGEELDSTNNVREEVLPSPNILGYVLLLLHPDIGDAIRWDGVAYADWRDDQRTDLIEAIRALENHQSIGLPAPPPLLASGQMAPDDAWQIFVHHVAHSLYIDWNRLVPWRLSDMPRAHLRLLLDADELMARSSSGTYYYHSRTHGSLTVWNPQISYEFMSNLGLLRGTHRDTIYAFADWARNHLYHIAGTDDRTVIYGYDGLPPADRILYPIDGQRAISPGCWGMSPLFTAALRGVNIPVDFGTVVYSGGLHARPIFPSIAQGLSHGDDPYSALNIPTGRPLPASDFFQSLSDIQDLYLSPTPECPGGTCLSVADQASFNSAVFGLGVVVDALGDYLLETYAVRGIDEVRSRLIGPTRGGDHFLHRPVFTVSQQNAIIAAVEAELRALGGGAIDRGEDVVRARTRDYREMKSRLRLIP